MEGSGEVHATASGIDPQYPLDRRLSGPPEPTWTPWSREMSPDPVGNRTPVVQPAARRCTECASQFCESIQCPHFYGVERMSRREQPTATTDDSERLSYGGQGYYSSVSQPSGRGPVPDLASIIPALIL
jgi:hypothetical protein